MKKFCLLIFCLSCMATAWTQSSFFRQLPLEITLVNNGTFLPGEGTAGIWSSKLHPGIQVGTRYYYFKKEKNELFQSLKLGYFYHQFAQQGWQLFTEIGYRQKIWQGIFAEAKLGGGYLLSVVDLQQFQTNGGTPYQQKSWTGRSQWMGGLNIGLGYQFPHLLPRPVDVYLAYHFWVQSPFVNKYVPILPNNAVQLGFIYYFH